MEWNSHEILIFSGFIIFISAMLALDLGVFNRKSHALTFREALFWTTGWIALSFLFYLLIRFFGHELHGFQTIEELQANIVKFHHPIRVDGMTLQEAIPVYNRNLSLEFLTGYLIEYSLSVDNIFVIIMIFLSFNIRPKYYHKVLFWGILGAIIMRFLFIFIASALIQRFEWVLLIFGGLLVVFGVRMGWEFFSKKDNDLIDTHKHPVVRFLSRFFAIATENHGSKFIVKLDNKIFLTPLFIVLVIIEFSDVIFAVDSVPAVFSVTMDPYIVFFSNIFAILGLRSLFFLVMDVMNRFRFLKLGLGVLLTFVGVKMLFHLPIDTRIALGIIIGILAIFVIASLIFPDKNKKEKIKLPEDGDREGQE